MNEILDVLRKDGLAVAIVIAIGLMVWRIARLASRKLFGNPDANPPIPGVVDRYVDQQKHFFDTMESHSEKQQELCERHANSLVTIADVLKSHDGYAVKRTEGIEKLVQLHTDPHMPGSTAEAIDSVRVLREAATETARLGQRMAKADMQNWAAMIAEHCEAMEQSLRKPR